MLTENNVYNPVLFYEPIKVERSKTNVHVSKCGLIFYLSIVTKLGCLAKWVFYWPLINQCRLKRVSRYSEVRGYFFLCLVCLFKTLLSIRKTSAHYSNQFECVLFILLPTADRKGGMKGIKPNLFYYLRNTGY